MISIEEGLQEVVEEYQLENATENYEDKLLQSILNDNSEEDEFEQDDFEMKNTPKQKSEYFNEEENDYKRTHKQRKQKTTQHLTEILR